MRSAPLTLSVNWSAFSDQFYFRSQQGGWRASIDGGCAFSAKALTEGIRTVELDPTQLAILALPTHADPSELKCLVNAVPDEPGRTLP